MRKPLLFFTMISGVFSSADAGPGAYSGAARLWAMKKIVLLILLALTALSPLWAGATPGEVVVGQTLREATMQGLTSPFRPLSAFRGKPLVINVWASWCGPCRQEMPSLERLSRYQGGKLFNVIGISTDDDPLAALAFLQKTSTSFSQFIDQRLVLENMLGASHLPLTVLVDAQGRVLFKHYGAKEWDSPEALKQIGQAFRLPM
jgi:thiol-disulfide isomerase/thioredoxin